MNTEPRSPVIEQLTRETAKLHVTRLVELVSMIPGVEYVEEDVLRESKANGVLMGEKWDHSYVLRSEDEIVGVLIAYIKQADGTKSYPEDSIYLSEIALDPKKRKKGLAKNLIKRYLSDCLGRKSEERIEVLPFTVQTNAAAWNQHVRSLYESFGFVVDGKKEYPNRSDVIMRASRQQVRQALSENHSH